MISFSHSNICKQQLDDIAQFIHKWYGVIGDEGCSTNVDYNFPKPLLWLHTHYKNVLNKLFVFNKPIQLSELSIEKGFVTFLIECQGVYIWKTEIGQESSKVFLCENKQPMECQLEEERLCGFLYQTLVFEAILSSNYHCMATWLSRQQLDEILRKWTSAPFYPSHWPAYPTQFYFTDNSLALTFPNEDGFTFQCGSNFKDALKFMSEFVEKNWEDVHI
jgi:hypothetical protein